MIIRDISGWRLIVHLETPLQISLDDETPKYVWCVGRVRASDGEGV